MVEIVFDRVRPDLIFEPMDFDRAARTRLPTCERTIHSFQDLRYQGKQHGTYSTRKTDYRSMWLTFQIDSG